jgi:hypothetical protein
MGEFSAWVVAFVFGIFLGVNSSSVRITTEEWKKAEEFCSKNDGIDKFVARTLDPNHILCKNSAKFILKEEKKDG